MSWHARRVNDTQNLYGSLGTTGLADRYIGHG